MPTILIVEDSPNDLLLIRTALTGLDPAPVVLTALDGAEALDLVFQRGEGPGRADGPLHLILLDLKMPRVDGFEVLRQVKGDPRLKSIPMIVFTSSREDADIRRCYDLGANAYVVKPVDFEAFLGAVKLILSFWGALNEAPLVPSAGAPAHGRLAGVA